MSTKIFLHVPDDNACTVYRASMPMLHLYHELSLRGIHITADLKVLKSENFDIFIFNRLIRPNFYQEMVVPWLKLGKSFVWQCDDDLWTIPDWNPASKLLNEFDLQSTREYINVSKAVWVSTDALKKAVDKTEKTKVLPNLIDINNFDQEINYGTEPIRVLWCGSSSHHRDFEDVIEPIIKIANKYKGKVIFIFWGYLPTELADCERQPGLPYASLVPKLENLYYGEWFSNREYFYKLRNFKPDIAIMPLKDCAFNISKSNLKYMEMSMAGAACVATDLLPYSCIANKETGILVKPGDEQGWFDALEELILNQHYRRMINLNAREQIRNQFSWQSSAREIWLKAFLELSGI